VTGISVGIAVAISTEATISGRTQMPYPSVTVFLNRKDLTALGVQNFECAEETARGEMCNRGTVA